MLTVIFVLQPVNVLIFSDPRTSGEDFSVGNLEQPANACLAFTQLLLDSAHSLPPACRTVGQFYVSALIRI